VFSQIRPVWWMVKNIFTETEMQNSPSPDKKELRVLVNVILENSIHNVKKCP
jgi:hypothetical protein